jgi:hypothetical protein
MTALDLIAKLLDHGADPNKAFTGQLHSATLCCSDEINASPFYRAAVAADVEALKLMLAHGADVEWSPKPVKKTGSDEDQGGGRGNANVGRTPVIVSINGGRGAAFAAGPGFERLGPPPFREASNREPVDAVKVLLAAGANPNIKTPDGSTPLHQAVTARRCRSFVIWSLPVQSSMTNKDNDAAVAGREPEPPRRRAAHRLCASLSRSGTHATKWCRARELMGLGPNDPAPVPPRCR